MNITDRATAAREDSLAYEYQREGRLQDAYDIWQQVITFDPDFDHGAPFAKMAECLEDMGEITAAKEAFAEAVRRDPDYYLIVRNYAGFLEEHNMASDAYREFLNVARLECATASISEDTLASIVRLGRLLKKTVPDVEKDLANACAAATVSARGAPVPADSVLSELVTALRERYGNNQASK